MQQQLSDRSFQTDDERWEAMVAKKAEAEGVFFYAVTTTGIYCRPTCSSRLPNRKNVLFFETYIAAEEAGFRACKRCRPKSGSYQQQQIDLVARICQQIDQSDEPLSLLQLATAARFSPYHFQRLFKTIVGITPKQYEIAQRAKKVRGELVQDQSITDAISNAGFSAMSGFYHQSSEILGMSTMSYRKGGRGVTIRYAVKHSSLGWVLVAATDRGICAVEFGDDVETTIATFQQRFANAILLADDPEFDRWVEAVVASIETPQREFNLPLDLQGTVFQQQVWQALRDIPPGKTATYTEVAERLGNPKAVRAVARACAANEIAVLIPCHRVVGRDGSLTGYRWGIHRKQALLDREKA